MVVAFYIFGIISFIISVFGVFSAQSVMHEIYSSLNFLIFVVCIGFAEILRNNKT